MTLFPWLVRKTSDLRMPESSHTCVTPAQQALGTVARPAIRPAAVHGSPQDQAHVQEESHVTHTWNLERSPKCFFMSVPA